MRPKQHETRTGVARDSDKNSPDWDKSRLRLGQDPQGWDTRNKGAGAVQDRQYWDKKDTKTGKGNPKGTIASCDSGNKLQFKIRIVKSSPRLEKDPQGLNKSSL